MAADPRTNRWRVRPSEPHDSPLYPDGFVLVRGRRKSGDWFRDRAQAMLAKTLREKKED